MLKREKSAGSSEMVYSCVMHESTKRLIIVTYLAEINRISTDLFIVKKEEKKLLLKSL